MPRSSGNLVDLPPAEKPPGEPFTRLFAGGASAQSDLGDSDPRAGDEGSLCRLMTAVTG
jgi:hypothetical protein